MSLPPAFFQCGTEDIFLDDTVVMSCKWVMAGGESIVKFYPGAPHGFTAAPSEMMSLAGEGRKDMAEF